MIANLQKLLRSDPLDGAVSKATSRYMKQQLTIKLARSAVREATYVPTGMNIGVSHS